MHDHAVRISKLGILLDGQWILRGFDLTIAPGEKVSLTGASGSGKSTVLKSILGFVAPREGSIRVFGRLLDGRSVWDIRRDVAYVAQEPDFGAGTAREVIEQPFAYKANAALRKHLERLPEIMEQFNVSQALLTKELSTLSGGEKQRFALISAILLGRQLILLDEASSALDRQNKQAVADFFRQATHLSVLSVAHDTGWMNFTDREVNLTRHGTPSEERR